MVVPAASVPSFSVNHERDHVVVVVTGDIDFEIAPALEAVLLELVEAGHRHIDVDTAEVTFLSVCGLNALLRAREAALHLDTIVEVTRPTAGVRRLLRLTDVLHLLAPSTPAGPMPRRGAYAVFDTAVRSPMALAAFTTEWANL